jgi:hypothetical protein
MRRLGLVFVLLLSLFGTSLAASAQDATPASGLASLGLPTLDITVTANTFEGIAESIPAGRYLVTVSVAEENAEGGGVGFIQPVGVSTDEFLAVISSSATPTEESSTAAESSPVAESSPAADSGEGEAPPPFIYQSKFAGGAYAGPGESAQVILDLTPGEWVVWGDNPEAPWTPVSFEATGEMPVDLAEPASTATLTIGEYIIEVSEGALTSGTQIIKVENIGAQPHFVSAGLTQKEITNEDLGALLMADMTGTPAPIDIDPDADFMPAFSTGTQSTGTSIWVEVDLSPGYLALLCYFPDISDGMPHAYHGMHNVVEIEE